MIVRSLYLWLNKIGNHCVNEKQTMTSNTRRGVRTLILSLPYVLLAAMPLSADDWMQFRGPGGLGQSSSPVPTQWSDDKNLLWKAKLPGPGSSSPIVVGDKVFVTCWTGATKKSTATLKRHVVCFDRGGKMLWQKDFPAPAKDFPFKGYTALHGYASSTPVSDGKRLFVFFGAGGMHALDLDGKELWQVSLGTRFGKWGSGASPVLHQNLVIVPAAVESHQFVALDQATGKKVWSQKVNGEESWSSPLLVQVGTRTELVVGEEKRLLGIDALTGELLWTCGGINDYICPTAVAHGGIIYAVGGLSAPGALAVKAGGRGDVSTSHRLWTIKKGSNVSSPVFHDGHLYWAHDESGIVYCADAKTGKLAYQERLTPASERIYASVTLADGKLFYVSRNNGTFVLQAGPQFKMLARNQFASDTSVFNGSPAFVDGRIYLRSDQALYCVGAK